MRLRGRKKKWCIHHGWVYKNENDECYTCQRNISLNNNLQRDGLL